MSIRFVMKQVHLLISGFVQGVGFRAFVRNQSQKLGLKGWVRNLSDNRVEVIAQGEEAILKELIKICEKGPFLSEVKNIAVEWHEPAEKFTSFEQKPTA